MSDSRHPTVVVFPYWPENPYLNVSYLAIRADGWVVNEQRRLTPFLTKIGTLESGDVIHLHWTSLLIQTAPDEAEAERRMQLVLSTIREATERGVRFVWTVHNRLPHDCPWPRQETELSNGLVALAAKVHVMSPQTRGVVADVFDIPLDKEALVRHPSYEGLYDQAWSRDEARASLELDASSGTTVLFFGHIKPYKGISALISAVGRTGDTLLLAGHASHVDRLETEAMIPEDSKIVTSFGYVPDDQAGRWFAAADVLVVPYAAILNSGSIHLASTFGLPVVVPAFPHLVEQFADESWVRFYDAAGGVEALAACLAEFEPSPELRASARAYALGYTPYAMATDMLSLYDSISA